MKLSSDLSADRYTIVNVHTLAFKIAIALIPIFGCAVIIGMRLWNFGIYRRLFTEDGLFEYLTSLQYFLASGMAIVIAWTFRRKAQALMAAAYALFALTLFVVAAEEISWGQRILDIETPSEIRERNTQHELTIHNLKPIQKILHGAYIAVGAYGTFFWLLTLPHGVRLPVMLSPYIVPRWYLSTYFLPVFLVYLHLELATRETALFEYRHPDQEPTEFIMSLGFLFFVFGNRCRQVRDFSLKKNWLFNVTWRSHE